MRDKNTSDGNAIQLRAARQVDFLFAPFSDSLSVFTLAKLLLLMKSFAISALLGVRYAATQDVKNSRRLKVKLEQSELGAGSQKQEVSVAPLLLLHSCSFKQFKL